MPRKKSQGTETTIDSRRLKIEYWPVEKLVPYGKNPRQIPEEAIAKVAGSLKAFGFRQPIVVDSEGVIVVGHTRLLAAQRLGFTEVPVHVAHDLSPADAKAYRLTDNKVAEGTAWNPELLALEFEELEDLGVDLDLTGFGSEEIGGYFDDAVEASVAEPQSGTEAETLAEKTQKEDGKSPEMRTIRFTVDQYELILSAIEKVRKMEGADEKSIPIPRALELLVGDWLAS